MFPKARTTFHGILLAHNVYLLCKAIKKNYCKELIQKFVTLATLFVIDIHNVNKYQSTPLTRYGKFIEKCRKMNYY
jgi:hypothetical protein